MTAPRHSSPVRLHRALSGHRWLLIVAVLVIGTLGWIGDRARGARQDLEQSRRHVAAARSAALDGDLPGAERAIAAAGRSADHARSRTRDPLVRAAGAVPVFGRSFDVAAALARSAHELTNVAGRALLASARELEAAGTTTAGSGTRVDVARLRAATPPLLTAKESLSDTARRLGGLPRRAVLPTLNRAAQQLQDQIADLRQAIDSLEPALENAPALLGEVRPQRYFLAFQTLAESRGTGGLIGAYSILTADRGVLTLSSFGNTSRDLRSPLTPVVDLGPEYAARYRDFGSTGFWSNVNASPHFPYTDHIVRGLWAKQFGQQLDGTIALDSFTLSKLLQVAGPVTMSTGETVTSENVVDLSLRQAYIRYDADQQNEFNRELAEKAGAKLLSGLDDPVAIVRGLADAVSAGHLRMAVANSSMQAILAKHAIGGVLSMDPTPFVGVSLNNAGATKLDYYLEGAVDYMLDRKTGRAVIDLSLTNTVDQTKLPRVGGTSVVPTAEGSAPPRGRNRLHVSVYCGVGATLAAGSLDDTAFVQEMSLPGEPWILGSTTTLLEPGVERGHGVFSTYIDIDAGQTRVLRIECDEPNTTGATRSLAPPSPSSFAIRISD